MISTSKIPAGFHGFHSLLHEALLFKWVMKLLFLSSFWPVFYLTISRPFHTVVQIKYSKMWTWVQSASSKSDCYQRGMHGPQIWVHFHHLIIEEVPDIHIKGLDQRTKWALLAQFDISSTTSTCQPQTKQHCHRLGNELLQSLLIGYHLFQE
jgi:hypothetical protein